MSLRMLLGALPIAMLPALSLARSAPPAARAQSRSAAEDWRPEDDERVAPTKPLVPIDKRWSAGVHVGPIPPTIALPALWFRPIQHLNLGLLGSFLPRSETQPWRFTLGALMRADFSNSNQSSWFVQGAYYRYRENRLRETGGSTTSIVPFTFGHLWRGGNAEVQLGAGVSAWKESRDEPSQSSSFAFGFQDSGVLPTLELGMRYRF